MTEMTKAVQEVLAARQRQIAQGWTPEHDDGHAAGEIITEAWGALCRLQGAAKLYSTPGHLAKKRDLLRKAAAQIIAELERIDRAEAKHRRLRPRDARTRRLEILESRFGNLGEILDVGR